MQRIPAMNATVQCVPVRDAAPKGAFCTVSICAACHGQPRSHGSAPHGACAAFLARVARLSSVTSAVHLSVLLDDPAPQEFESELKNASSDDGDEAKEVTDAKKGEGESVRKIECESRQFPASVTSLHSFVCSHCIHRGALATQAMLTEAILALAGINLDGAPMLKLAGCSVTAAVRTQEHIFEIAERLAFRVDARNRSRNRRLASSSRAIAAAQRGSACWLFHDFCSGAMK